MTWKRISETETPDTYYRALNIGWVDPETKEYVAGERITSENLLKYVRPKGHKFWTPHFNSIINFGDVILEGRIDPENIDKNSSHIMGVEPFDDAPINIVAIHTPLPEHFEKVRWKRSQFPWQRTEVSHIFKA